MQQDTIIALNNAYKAIMELPEDRRHLQFAVTLLVLSICHKEDVAELLDYFNSKYDMNIKASDLEQPDVTYEMLRQYADYLAKM